MLLITLFTLYYNCNCKINLVLFPIDDSLNTGQQDKNSRLEHLM